MKELSIEEKAKRYDEAIERAKYYYDEGKTLEYATDVASDVFPELKESEDEKIKESLIKIVNDLNTQWIELHGVTKENAIAWLEKQGSQILANSCKTCKDEHINFIEKIQIGDQVTRNEDGVLVNLSQLKRVAEKVTEDKESATKFLKSAGIMNESGELAEQYRQGEQKPAMIQWKGDNLKEVIDFTGKSPKFDEWFNTWSDFENYVHSHNDILKLFCEDGSHYEVPVGAWIVRTPDGYNVASQATYKQKAAEWSEEDERFLNVAINILNSSKVYTKSPEKYEDTINWLKSLKDRVQPKQEWSEEDSRILYNVIAYVGYAAGERGVRDDAFKEANSWLKSLRPQKQWKPSKKQITALSIAVKYSRTDDLDALEELLEQLKAL